MQRFKQDLSIGANLKKLRKAAHYTQEGLTAQMQLYGCATTRGIYSQIETGTYNIRISELLVLKEIFHCEWEDFFKGLPTPKKAEE